MRAISEDFGRALLLQRGGGITQRPSGIDDVVDQDAGPSFDISDDVHHLGFSGAFTALVDDRQRSVVETLGETARTHHAADVGRYDDQLAVAEPRLDVG